jgi:hypothetical protein
MIDLLPDLHTSPPSVLRGETSTLGTLSSLHDQGKDESLLQDCTGEDLLLDDDFQFETSGVRLGPEERGVDESDSGEGFGDFLKTDGCVEESRMLVEEERESEGERGCQTKER